MLRPKQDSVISFHNCAAFVETLHIAETPLLLSEELPKYFPQQEH